MAANTMSSRITGLPTESRSWLDNISPETRQALSASARTLTLSRGQILYERKAAPSGIYLIIKGNVRITFQSGSGSHHLLKIGAPGGVVGDLACIDGKAYPVFAEAMTRCSFEFITRRDFDKLRQTHPDINAALLIHFSRISRSLLNLMEATMLGGVKTRVASRIAFLCREYGSQSLQMSQTDLSLMVGISRQATNAALKELAALKLIDTKYGKINILDFEALAQYIENTT